MAAHPPLSIQRSHHHTSTGHKILGITLTPDLKMDQHIWTDTKSLYRNINTKTALISNIKPCLTQQQLSVVGGALVNSSFLYAAPIWGTTTQQNIDKVQKIPNKSCQSHNTQQRAKRRCRISPNLWKWPLKTISHLIVRQILS